MKRLFELVAPLIKNGIDVIVSYNDGNYEIDLQTGMKSECIVTVDAEGGTECRGRYDHVTKVTTTGDIIDFVLWCRCGRPYMRNNWHSYFIKHGIDCQVYSEFVEASFK